VNLRGLAFLALRLMAIYVIVMGIRHAVDLVDFSIPAYMQLADLNFAKGLLVIGIPTLLLWIVGILLWFMAGKWSNRFVPATNGAPEAVNRSAEFESFVLSVVGLVLAILSLTNWIQSVLGYISLTNQDVYFNRQSYYFHFAGQAAEFVLGAVLLLKSRGIAALLRKIRSAGMTSDR